jgi:hypothetical protein
LIAGGLAFQASSRIVPNDGLDSNLEEINARTMLLGGSLANVGGGLAKLADAIKDVYDKLEVIDRKLSCGAGR